jgi:hypothetical protein
MPRLMVFQHVSTEPNMDRYPHLAPELKAIESALRQDKPVLGIWRGAPAPTPRDRLLRTDRHRGRQPGPGARRAWPPARAFDAPHAGVRWRPMLLSHDYRFLFVHIQKTAGSSIAEALGPYCSRPPRVGLRKILSHLPVPESPDKVAFRKHATARWARLKLPNGMFDAYCKFTVVRNPFDRAVSFYHYVKQETTHHSHRHVGNATFMDYLKYLYGRDGRRDPTQRYRVTDRNGKLLCNRILKFEHLNSDFAELCRELKLPGSVTLPHTNATARKPWCEYYDDPRTRALLVDTFADDFEMFGYSTAID